MEVHIINFIIHETDKVLTDSDAELIAKEYTKNNKALKIFSPEFVDLFREGCVKEIKKYIGVSRRETVYNLLKFYKTWDNYSLSILYLKTFEYIFGKGFQGNSMIILFSQLLLLNISPDHLVVDGNWFVPYQDEISGKYLDYTTVIGGDDKFYSIAAASILAKVDHDRYINQLCLKYPLIFSLV